MNAAVSGMCLGVVAGLLCTAVYKVLRSRERLQACADQAFDVVQTPLFWLGLANGALIGVLTASKFRGASIWKWQVF
jgi:hypothetical protein